MRMAGEQGRDSARRVRTEKYVSPLPKFGLYFRTVSSSNQDTIQRNLNVFPHSSNRNVTDAANMPIFLEDTHESNISTSRDFNTDSNIRPSNVRLHNTSVSAALEALQSYGPIAQSPSRSPMQKDWNIDLHKNIYNPKKLPVFQSGILKSKDSNMQARSAESSIISTSDISCQPFSDLNLNNIDEEDEYLYGDSNSLPETPQLLKREPDQNDVKTEHPGWSDDEDLFSESSDTLLSKLSHEQMKSSTVWSLRNKNIPLKLTQKPGRNTSDSSNRNMPHETFSVEQHNFSVSSADYQNVRPFPNTTTENDVKSIVHDKDSMVTSTSGVKSKYHVAAQVLRKKIIEKSKLISNKTTDFPNNSPDDMKNNSVLESFKNNIPENELATKSSIPIKDSKELKIRKPPGENVKRLPKAFLQKDLKSNVDYINRSQRKRVLPREEFEHIKHPRYGNYRDLSPSRHHSPYLTFRKKFPEDENRHRSPYHARHKSPSNDLQYRLSHHFKHKSPHRDYDRHSYEFSTRHNAEQWHHSHSPDRKSREMSPKYHKYRTRSPGSQTSKERSRGSGSHISKERSRSPGYHRSIERSNENENKKDSYKSREMLSKRMPEHSESVKKKKTQNYSSDESIYSLSGESESESSGSFDNSEDKKEKSTTKLIPKEKVSEDSKSEACKVEKKALDVCVKNADISQNLADICNYQHKTSGDIELSNDFFKSLDKDKDKLINIVKMFENSQIISELVEGVQEHATVTAPILPPDVTHNTPNLPTPSASVPSVSFPTISSSQPYPILPSVPISFHPLPVNSFPPLTFPPPPVMPPPVMPPPVVPPPVAVSLPPTSVYGPFPVSIPSVDVCRISDTKQVKKRPSALRPINITMDVSSKSSNEHSNLLAVKLVELKEKRVEKEKVASETFLEQNKTLIETFKKLKTEKHCAHIKVNNCRNDIIEMRKMMDDTWGKKVNSPDRVFYPKCKNILAISIDSMHYCVKEAKRLDEELSKVKGRLPRQFLDELGNVKVEQLKVDNTEYYSCFDSSNHTCYLCYKQFSNLLGILEHLQSTEHKEQMTSNDKDWINMFKKPEQNEEGKVVLKPVAGVEFMKPFTGYFCTLCSETLLDSTNAELHLKSHDHFCKYKDYILKNPLYEKKCLFKKYIKHSVFSKDKKKREMQRQEQHNIDCKKAEEVNEKVKDIIKDQKSKEKKVEELEENDADPLTSKNQSMSGIKLTLSGDKEKNKQNVKEKSSKVSANKTIQKVVFIGKAPNYKARPKPWYKKDIYLQNAESSLHSAEPTLSAVTLVKEKEKSSEAVRESSPTNKSDLLTKNNQCFLGDDISETVKKREKVATKKMLEATCLTEEDSKKISTSCSNLNDVLVPCKEENSTASNDSTTCSIEEESKNLNISCDDPKNISISSTKKNQPVPGDSGSILDSKVSTKQSTTKQNEKYTCNQPQSLVNEYKGNTMPMTEDSTVNQALKNILLGTDSSVHRDIPLSEIKLPDIPVQSSIMSNFAAHGESNIPIPMEIEDTNEKFVFSSHPKLTTEEDRDLFILGINREDLIPLVVPVPPPSSVLNCASPNRSSAASSPSHKPHLRVTQNSSNAATKINKNTNESMVIPVLVSTHLNESFNFKKQTLASRQNKCNLIIPNNNTLNLECLLKSDTEKTSATTTELKNSITICKTVESTDVNASDVAATMCIKSQDVNIETSVNTVMSKKNSVLQINETSLETTKTKPVETDNIKEASSQISDACEGNENLNKVYLSDNEDLKRESNTNICLMETVSEDKIINQSATATVNKEDSILQINETSLETTKTKPVETDNIEEASSQISDTCEGNENLNKVYSRDNEDFKKEPDTNICVMETVSEDKIIDQSASSTDSVILKAEQASSDNISISKCKPSDSFNLADKSVEINAKLSVAEDSDNGVFISSLKPEEVYQDSSVNDMPEQISNQDYAQQSIDLNQVSSEKSIAGKEVCSSSIKTIAVENQPYDNKFAQDLVLGLSFSQDSSKEVTDEEICKTVHMQDQKSDINSCQSLIIKQPLQQESCKESVSETYIDSDILVRDQQSNSDIKPHQSSGARQLLDQVSVKESISDIELYTSNNKTAQISQQYIQSDMVVESEQSFRHDSHKENMCDMKVCASICKICPEMDQPSSIKPNLNLACSTDSVFPIQTSEKNESIETVDPTVNVMDSEQQVVYTNMTLFYEKEHEELITSPSPTYKSCKESISDMKISLSISESADINVTVSVNNSSEGVLASNSGIIPKQCLFKNICSADAVRMEIVPQQQATFTEKDSQNDVISDHDLNSAHSSNQNLVAENISDITESRLHQECDMKQSSETEFVENIIYDTMSTGCSDLISENLCENKCSETAYSDNKNLESETVLMCMKRSECEVTSNEGVISHLSSNQCDSTSKRTALYAVDPNSSEESVKEGLNPAHVSIIEESISGQVTTQQKHDAISESTANEKQLAGTDIDLKPPGLEDNVGDSESKMQILSSSSGDVNQNLSKSDTDTDEYDTEE